MKNSNKISAIIFDYGGVIEISDIKISTEITNILGITKEEWRKVYFSYNYLINIENREWKDVILMVAEKLGATAEQLEKILDLINERQKKKKLNTELLGLIKKLRGLGLKTAVLSNYALMLRERITKQNIAHLFDEIIISSEEGHQKPDKRLFEILFKKLGVPATNAIFIDDTPNSLKLAEEIGYIPILYKDNESLKNSLSKILGIEL
jgi:putative hydrolase of the HAD superfamily